MSLECSGENLHMKAFSSSPFSEAATWKPPDYIPHSSPIYVLTIYPTTKSK